MKRLLTFSAAALSLALVAGAPALGQDQMDDAVMTGLAQLGIETEGMVLTQEQTTQVQAILNDAGTDEDDKVARIEALMAN